ncbi:sensor domain-containing diguanylate cyclase [Undibacterium jejuense]|uniref:Sensor domain-containing diguanylate cyclase n=2 Tax=Undibacterium jejuense TaxID=1344949 RepID=A0A923HEF6_9BURK|nr:sensor domain-containing diguanylate cyclase [Undibacterium jejuense]
MAKRIFNVPIALVSLVDENRQWFKSCDGLNVKETDRQVSFCAHAILEQNTLVIHDTKHDERFFDNPLVTSTPYIRFYAGHPLRTHYGDALGTLCIIDTVPRTFPQEDIEMLIDLAGIVERELITIKLSLIDDMTRISNRRGFIILSKYSLEICKRQLFPTGLVFFDLNKFKEINDTYGHAEGDKALMIFADQMRSSFRSSDILARLGGDEFVALLTNTQKSDIDEMILRFKKTLHDHCINVSLPYTIGFSYGVTVFDQSKHFSIEDMMQEADHAMYRDKITNRLKLKRRV